MDQERESIAPEPGAIAPGRDVRTPTRLLVTGARGAIGRHVVRLAAARGHRVLGLGHGQWSGDAGLPPIDAWVNGEVGAENLDALAAAEGVPDLIVHLAGGSLVGASVARPAEDFRRTVEAAQRLFEWLRTASPATRVVIASSAAVYGDRHPGAIAESAGFSPTSPYGTHKAMMELLASSYARQFGIRSAIVRFFSVYGPELRKQLVWELTGRFARAERDITLGGSGAERRDFLHVADAATMLLDAASLASDEAPVFNGATGRATSVADMAALIGARFDAERPRFSGESRPGDPLSLVADTTRAEAAGLHAPTELERGLAGTLDWIMADAADIETVGADATSLDVADLDRVGRRR